MKKLTVSLVVLLMLIISCSKETVTPERELTKYISGKLLGFDGKPMKLAHVHAYIYGKQKQVLTVQAEANGSFSIPIKSADYIELEFTGVDHKLSHLELFNFDSDKNIEMTIKLSANSLKIDIENLTVLGNFNQFSFSDGLVPMAELANGVYEAMVQNIEDTVFYQILGSVSGSRSVNGTMAHGYVYDGGGDYRSYIVTKDTLIKIIYDSKQLQMESVPAKFSSNDEKLNSYFIALEQLNELSDLAIVEYNKTKNVNSYYTFYYNGLNKLLKENNYSRTRMLVMQKLIEIAYATGKDIDKTMIKSHLELIGPYSVYWEKSVSLVIPALELLGEKKYKEDFIDKMISKNPSHSIRQGILYNLISFYFEKQDKENGIKYYNILINTYPDAKITKSAKKEFSPDRKMIVGKALPDFSYENIDKPGDMITNKTFSGKLCFIDIWATWCGPCVGEMEHLHNVYNKFKNKNFAMYSISIDANKEDIGKFRQGKWKMPWLHSFSDGIWKSKVVELFEVSGVPQPMLISPDGIILEMGVSLRGEDLESTIEKYLKK